MWRKTRSLNNLFCDGVDPNRNFDINWSGWYCDFHYFNGFKLKNYNVLNL